MDKPFSRAKLKKSVNRLNIYMIKQRIRKELKGIAVSLFDLYIIKLVKIYYKEIIKNVF